MKPLAVLGAIITIVFALFVVSKLTAPTSPASTVAATPPPAKTEASSEVGTTEPPKPEEDPTDVNYKVNPFDLKKPGPYPKAVFDDATHEFGAMRLGETNKKSFFVKNEGEAPLKLEKGPLQCKCTMPALGNKEIPPGGQAEIVLEWKPLAIQSGFEKEAIIWTNDPANSKLSLRISGDVVSDDIWQPAEGFNLEQVKQGDSKTVTGWIMSKMRDDLKIEKVEKSSEAVQVEYQPATPEELKEQGAKCGFVFKLTVPPNEDISLIHERVTVWLNSANNTQIIWNITGSRTGPISIVGPAWYADKQLVMLGHFRASEGAEKKVSVFVYDKTEKPMELSEVKVDGPIKVSIERDAKWTNPANDRYFLTVSFTKNGAVSQRNADNPLPVVLRTTHPKVQVLRFNVSYDAD